MPTTFQAALFPLSVLDFLEMEDAPLAQPRKPRPNAPLGLAQQAIIVQLRPSGRYIRRQMHDGYVRSWIAREGERLEIGAKGAAGARAQQAGGLPCTPRLPRPRGGWDRGRGAQ